MADYVIRVVVSDAFENAKLFDQANKLRNLPKIIDRTTADAARSATNTVRAAARIANNYAATAANYAAAYAAYATNHANYVISHTAYYATTAAYAAQNNPKQYAIYMRTLLKIATT